MSSVRYEEAFENKGLSQCATRRWDRKSRHPIQLHTCHPFGGNAHMSFNHLLPPLGTSFVLPAPVTAYHHCFCFHADQPTPGNPLERR